jgi:hypothetical protein
MPVHRWRAREKWKRLIAIFGDLQWPERSTRVIRHHAAGLLDQQRRCGEVPQL